MTILIFFLLIVSLFIASIIALFRRKRYFIKFLALTYIALLIFLLVWPGPDQFQVFELLAGLSIDAGFWVECNLMPAFGMGQSELTRYFFGDCQ